MSKFAAWSDAWTSKNYGIRLQMLSVDMHQQRQYLAFTYEDTYYQNSQAQASSTAPGWDATNIVDGHDDTAWSSAQSSSEDSQEHFGFWFGKNPVNFLELTPRRTNGRAYCFPQRIEILYSAGPNNPQFVREVELPDPGPQEKVLVSLDRTIETDGLIVKAKRLRKDDGGKWYFQMAGARACFRSLKFDQPSATSAAERFPASLFFFGDEPDLFVPADEYARAYDEFVKAIKSGSATAQVSPAGFTFANPIFGSTYTDYAEKFFQAKSTRVDEWRFHFFYWPNDYPAWEAQIKKACTWSRDHGAPMVVGSFGSPDPRLAELDMREYQRQAMTMLAKENSIVEAVYCSFNWSDPHTLITREGKLTPDGELFLQLM